MHGWETRMLLRHYLQRGVSKAALARRFGVSRRTIHEWVETGQLDRDERDVEVHISQTRGPQTGVTGRKQGVEQIGRLRIVERRQSHQTLGEIGGHRIGRPEDEPCADDGRAAHDRPGLPDRRR